MELVKLSVVQLDLGTVKMSHAEAFCSLSITVASQFSSEARVGREGSLFFNCRPDFRRKTHDPYEFSSGHFKNFHLNTCGGWLFEPIFFDNPRLRPLPQNKPTIASFTAYFETQ